MNTINTNITSGSNASYWVDTISPISYNRLDRNCKTDVIVVGGGIAGVSIAYRLSQVKMKVVLIEDGFIGSGETGRTSAHLVTCLDNRYYELQRLYGDEGAKLVAQSHADAIDFIEEACSGRNLDCGFRRVSGYLFLSPSDNKDNLKREFQASTDAGIKVKMLKEIPGLKKFNQKPCIEFPVQATFHPLKYLKGLCDAIISMGGKIYTETKAADVDDKGVTTATGFRVNAKHIVIATNSPINNKYAIHLKQFPYRSYIIGCQVKKNSLPDALWWDSGDFNMNSSIPPYHFVRTASFNKTHDLLLCGGEDHPTGMPELEKISEEARYEKLEKWLHQRFAAGKTIYKWSGQIMQSMDELAFIGRNPHDVKNIYITTGDSGNGLTYGTIGAMLISDLIMGKKNPYEHLYDPSRFKFIKAGSVWLKEFVLGYIKYLQNTPRKKELKDLNKLKPGNSMLIKIEKKSFGVHRDEHDAFHFVAAECTHAQCIVKWNADEKTWDCPCHGSRFTREGKVINGPANRDLEYFREDTDPVSKRRHTKTSTDR